MSTLACVRELSQFVGGQPMSAPSRSFEWASRHFPEIHRAAASMDAVARSFRSPGGKLLQEWNPLGQRVHMAEHGPAQVIRSYAQTPAAVGGFAELAHELAHVLLWEPFFCGRVNPTADPTQFMEFCVQTEAFCFWFGDVWIYNRIARELLKDENLYANSVGFGDVFNPRSVLRKHGYRGPRAQIDVYLDLFGRTSLTRSWRAKNDEWQVFVRRADRYRVTNDRLVGRWHHLLRRTHVSTEFFHRFCAVPGLPQTFDTWPASLDAEGISAFVHAFFSRALGQIAEMPFERLARVRVRRRLQQRAYFLYQLRFAQANEYLRTSTLRAVRIARLTDTIERTLDLLEDATHRLAAEAPLRTLDVKIRTADDVLDAGLALLRGRDVFVGRRELLMVNSDFLELDIDALGLTDLVDLPPLEMMLEIGAALAPIWPATAQQPRWLDTALRWLTAERSKRGSSAAFDRFLAHPQIRPQWTVEPGLCHPRGNGGRELLFELT